ncbi:GNAT family N-acetyltransferase [Kribbella catacumbae]|uniref:GNAT family N-acetyltransferase n=1 Tax=Kribbella catacumbae TaxID=460086 RepID=UPI00037A4629|nr:GNAT family N-acetyltransferase [Kribbella catacumbae]
MNRPTVAVTLRGSVDGLPLCVRFLGTAVGRLCIVPYLQELLGAAASERAIDDPLDPAEWDGADLVVVEGNAEQVWVLPREASVVLPMHVHMVTELPGSVEELDGLVPRKERARVRRQIREHGYTYRVTEDEGEFLWFYERMYAPTMRARHAENARSVGAKEALERVFRKGNLLLVCTEDGSVGGTANFLDRERGQVMGRLVGVLGGAPEHFRNGVLKATGRYLLEWACEAGYRSVDFQGCEPFLRNGTFQAKVLLGATVTHAPGLSAYRLWLSARVDSAATRAFLLANPPLTCAPDGSFTATHFTDSAVPAPLSAMAHRGIAATYSYPVGEFLSRRGG